jgi:hypothetical protein
MVLEQLILPATHLEEWSRYGHVCSKLPAMSFAVVARSPAVALLANQSLKP